MAVEVRLLGAPSVIVDGAPRTPPRGRKAWALLAYLLLTDEPQSRRRLAALLFPDAEDPLGALRWSLAGLRRCLGPAAELTGDPVRLLLAADVTADVAAPPSDAPGELLEGIELTGCPGFEVWLCVERQRLAAACEAALHERALADLAAGNVARALTASVRLVTDNPLDENHQTLLVRALARSGQRAEARRQVIRCTQLFRDELGAVPSPALREAAEDSPAPAGVRDGLGGAAAGAGAELEAGCAALAAGAVDAGLACLRRAVAGATSCRDGPLRLRASIALGSALVHAVRGRDEEGAAVLHEALLGAQACGDQSAAARVARELGFVEVQAGRRARAERWLTRAESLAGADELAAVLGVQGMSCSDAAHYPEALERLEWSVECATREGDGRQVAWSMSLIGRIHLLRGDLGAAAHALDAVVEGVRVERWTAFSPWPESMRAEVDLAQGRPELARQRSEHAFAMACRLGDPCWEGMAGRAIALVSADSGDLDLALRWLEDASHRCTRWPDTYQWVRAHVLDAATTVAIRAGDPRAGRWVAELAGVAARGGMRELVVRSHVHRAMLGHDGAAEAAVHVVVGLDNPAVADLVRLL